MIYSILLQTQTPSGSAIGPQLLFMVAIIAVFYFFMIRPQQKKAKDQKKFTEEIKKGDYVVTIGGLHGRIAEIEDDTFIIEVERGARLKYSKSSISMESTKTAAGKKQA
ncbi:MAG: preprotein translocase subunit YajC [Cyclobacteriaceae bacterium]|nr:preprotein translocase subunit YajC [Cytophagales bacterium]MBX2900868.1 preprotein translocase subunit YajC [Cyclobacteriaceae bacterium]